MNKILIIAGPTATGKTDLAIKLARKLNGEIISADSRQVYRGMTIGTGKDICDFEFRISSFEFNKKKLIYHEKAGVKLWGYDVVNPDEEWSPAQFAKMAKVWIGDIRERNKLPIIVGGDGFYIQALINPPSSLYIPPNRELRKELEANTVQQLQNKLKKLDQERFNRMNWSDRNNPRRLIRAIEVALSQPDCHGLDFARPRDDIVWIGLTAPIQLIDEKIEKRVRDRVQAGIEKEVRNLVNKYGWNQALLSTIAYKEWKDYFEGKEERGEVIKKWIIHEKQYARKQMVWFKKQKDIHWFDISPRHLEESATKDLAKQVLRFYDSIKQ